MSFYQKLKTVLDHYKIKYWEVSDCIAFNLKDYEFYVYHEKNKYRMVKDQQYCIDYEEYFFKPSQFNDLADIILENIDD